MICSHGGWDGKKESAGFGLAEPIMKMKIIRWCIVLTLFGMGAGCVSIPPLIKVEHKTDTVKADGKDEEILRRLDAIERRLDRLDEKVSNP